MRTDEIRDAEGRRTAEVIVIHDVTQLHRQRIEANRRLEEQLQLIDRLRAESEQAARDELTGAFNRRYLMAQLEHSLREAASPAPP